LFAIVVGRPVDSVRRRLDEGATKEEEENEVNLELGRVEFHSKLTAFHSPLLQLPNSNRMEG